MQNIYDAPPSPSEEHQEAIDYIQTIVKGMQTQRYDLEGMAQANTVLTSSNSALMAQLVQITLTINAIHAQLKKITSEKTNQASTRIKHY